MSASPDRALRIAYPLLWSRPGRQACREQTVNTAAALARRGHSVTLVMPRGAGDPALGADELRDYFRVEGDFRIVQRRGSWVSENAVASALWLRRTFRDPELLGADLILSRIPMLLAFGGAAPRPFALDHYRPWPDDLPFIRPFVRRTAASARCLGLIIHSHYAAGSYVRAGVSPDKILVAHNGAARRPGAEMDKETVRARLGLPQARPIAAYAGRLNLRKGLDQVLAIASLRPEILFLLIGSEGGGPIERAAAACANVRIVPWQEPDALGVWLRAADVLLIPPARAPLERYRDCVLPMKLFAYLAAGRPILAPRSPDTAELLDHERTALLVPPGSPPDAAAMLDRIIGDSALAGRLAANAGLLAEGLSWDGRAARISDFLLARLRAAERPGLRLDSLLGV